VKVVKLKGEFLWHHHDNEDELFLVVKGQFRMRYLEDGREQDMVLNPGEFVVIPRRTEHLPMLLEPKGTGTPAMYATSARWNSWKPSRRLAGTPAFLYTCPFCGIVSRSARDPQGSVYQ
jgi:mannose-6-phosphate isomerase-like protein (cupin superfamily)